MLGCRTSVRRVAVASNVLRHTAARVASSAAGDAAAVRQRPRWAALIEASDGGRMHIVELTGGKRKIRGLGRLDPAQELDAVAVGATVSLAQKTFTRLPLRLPELNAGLVRRAQTISPKDAGYLVARLGIGAGDRILEAGLGSGALSLHIARSLGSSGLLVTVEPRAEHAEVGLENLRRAQESWPEFPTHHAVAGRLEEQLTAIGASSPHYDGIVLDLPDHVPAVAAAAPLLAVGGRLACYCPVTSQLEAAIDACAANGLEVEWAGELIERPWARASKGGMRPVTAAFGHTAFLLIAQRRSLHMPEPPSRAHAPSAAPTPPSTLLDSLTAGAHATAALLRGRLAAWWRPRISSAPRKGARRDAKR
jgi:tRNA (adenine57-N1/adenine58-N1)-methyltransferase